MNLLRVQDALKNASDQQLMALMQSPDSTAPSYLVLSEIRRRKDMRAKQAPEGDASGRTVAEELTAPEQPSGIQALQGQMDPDGVDAVEGGDVDGVAAGGLASLRRYREGGVVRMQAGGQPPMPIRDLRDEDLLSYYNYFMGQQRPLTQAQVRSGRIGSVTTRDPAMSSPYDFISIANELDRRGGIEPPQIFSPQNEGAALRPGTRSEDIYRSVSSLPAFGGEEDGRPAPSGYVAPPPDADRDAAMGRIAPRSTAAPATQPAAARPASPVATQPAPAPAVENRGIGALRNAAPALPEGGQLPTMADLMRQNAALFPDGMGGIRERMREERVDPASRRSEAVNMALIEAGLRIAGSRNPSLIGAIGEGALPAVQSYGQQLGQIRAERRQDLRDELELAKQETNRQFAIGQISAAEYRSRMDNINANLRVNAQERGANARAAAAESAADRRATAAAAAAEASDLRRGFVTPEQYAGMTPEQREQLRELRGIGRPADVAGSAQTLRVVTTELQNLRRELAELPPEPPATRGIFGGSPNPEREAWRQRRAAIEAQIADAERLRRFHEGVLETGRSGARTGTGGSGQSVLNYDPETRTLR